MKIFYDPIYTYGIDDLSRFPKERYQLIYEEIVKSKNSKYINFVIPKKAKIEEISLAHDPNYVKNFLNNKNLNNRFLIKKFNDNSSINFKYFKFTKKGGAFGVRNFIVKKISTPYVAFLDDDDFWDKDYYNNPNHSVTPITQKKTVIKR